MSQERVTPATRIDGEVVVPGDKSMSHRALILGALAKGRTYLGNLSPAADVGATMACLRACGVWVRDFPPARAALDGAGNGVSLKSPNTMLDCGNSGTTMRLLAGAIAGNDCDATLDGDESLRRRPMARVADPLRAMGAIVEAGPAGRAPLHVRGTRVLTGLTWTSPVASAQVKSAILLAALSADGPTTVIEPMPTRDHTERMLRMCGIEVVTDGACVTVHPAPVQPFGFRVPGDISSAAFFLALAASRPGWRVRCPGVGLNPGRTGIIAVLSAMGAEVLITEGEAAGGVEPVGDVEVRGAHLHGVTISGALTVRCIDELPIIAVLASQADGATEIRDAGELRNKETDRIAMVEQGLRLLGVSCESTADSLIVHGPTRLRPATLDAAGDHRLAMAWAIAAALVLEGAGESVIAGAEAAAVSYPGFFTDLADLMAASD
jgi:3-phosphoshikimate 1-carboxyvinyltransferase